MAKGKGSRQKEIIHTKNFPTQCKICDTTEDRPTGLESHLKEKHAREGFICDNCKALVPLSERLEHGYGKCEKLCGTKNLKETKKEKKKQKEAQREVRGYVSAQVVS